MIQEAIPEFGRRRLSSGEVLRACETAGVDVLVCDMAATAAMFPMMMGRRRMFISSRIPPAAKPFVLLHELCHVIRGDAEELTRLELDETRYPLEDRIADAVAAIGVTTPRDRLLPPDDLARWLQVSVPLDSRAWQVYRAGEVAGLLGFLTLDASDWS